MAGPEVKNIGRQTFFQRNFSPLVGKASGKILLGSGLNRGQLLTNLTSLPNLSPLQESQIIRILEGERVIKNKYSGQFSSLSELNEAHLSLALTPSKLEQVRDTLYSALGTDFTAAFAPFVAAMNSAGLPQRGLDLIGDRIWRIRESLYRAESEIARMQMLTALLARTTEKVAVSPINRNDLTPEIRHSLELFLNETGPLLGAMKQDSSALLRELQRKGYFVRNRNISGREIKLYENINAFLQNLDLGSESTSLPADSPEKLLKLLEDFHKIPEISRRKNKHLTRVLDSMIEVAQIIKANPNNSSDQLTASYGKLIININQLLKQGDCKNWPLRIWAAAAIGVSLIYITYRLVGTLIMQSGYDLPSFLSALSLILAEAFCNYSSIVNNTGVLQSLIKTKGAHGQSWVAKKRTQLSRDPFKRPPAALFLSSFNEPVKPLLDSTKAAIRAVWNYGNASLKILDDSAFSLYFYFGISASVRWVRRMSAVKEALTQIANQSGIIDIVACHSISTDLASRSTELDDPETKRFAILRTAQDSIRSHNVYEKKVMRLADRIYTHYERTNGTITETYVLSEALDLNIPESKALAIAKEITAKIISLKRKSEIARLGGKILDEEPISNAEYIQLVDLIVAEHLIPANLARTLIDYMRNYSRDLYTLSRAITDEVDLLGAPEKRVIFNQAHALMERIMRFDERENNFETHLGNKCRQIIEWTTSLHGSKASRLGAVIAQTISNLPRTTTLVEDILRADPSLTYEQADRRAWEAKKSDIETIVVSLAARDDVNSKDAKPLVEKIIDELAMNREERFSATFEICQYLANKLLAGKTPDQAVDDLDKEKQYLGGRKPDNVKWMKEGLVVIAKALSDLGLPSLTRVPTPPSLTGLDHNLIRARVEEYSEMIHRDKVVKSFPKENSGKAGAINNAIHGLTRDEMVAEMLRQAIHRHVEEKYASELHIPEALETDLDRNVSDLVPDLLTNEANPRHMARALLSLIISGRTPEQAADQVLINLQIPIDSQYKAKETILRVAREMQARVALYEYLIRLSSPGATCASALQGVSRLNRLNLKERSLFKSLAKAVKKGINDHSIILEVDPVSGVSIRGRENEPPTSPARILCEQVNHLIIVPEGRSVRQIIDSVIAIRRLPENIKRSKSPEPLVPELRNYIPQLEAFFRNHEANIRSLQQQGLSPHEIANWLIDAARNEVVYTNQHKDRNNKVVNSPMEQMVPQMSSLKYKVIGCFDADYRINSEALHEMVPYFTDHPTYFFLGKRQYGRNWPNNNLARVMQNAQDGYWGFQNMAASLANNAASWGSCVFHSTESYVESSKWIEQKRNYGWLWDLGIRKVNKDTYLGPIKVPGNFRWYQLWDPTQKDPKTGETVGGWIDARKYTPLRVINALQRLVEIVTGIEKLNPGFKKKSLRKTVSTVFLPIRAATLPFHIPHVLFGAPLKNWLHERGARGKRLGWERSSDQTVDMLSSQDFTTESEDIASCMYELRKMPYLSGNGIFGTISQKLSLRTGKKMSSSGYGKAHQRSGYVEGIGGLGSHAEDFRAYYATDLTRWRRGNLDLLAEISNTPMTLWAKLRYKLLAQNWLLGLLRMSFIAMPPLFAFTGVDPIIVGTSSVNPGATDSLMFLGIMAFGNFFANIGAYFANMSSRGHGFLDSWRAMLIDYYFLITKAKSVIDGRFIRERAAFVTSPKKTVVPLKANLRQMSWEHGLAIVNLLAAGYATWFGIQTLQPGIAANIPKFFVPFWSLFNFGLIEGAVSYMNKGVKQNKRSENSKMFDSDNNLPSEEGKN
jgi:hypothetical protein